jgi:hypothetical protein
LSETEVSGSRVGVVVAPALIRDVHAGPNPGLLCFPAELRREDEETAAAEINVEDKNMNTPTADNRR